MTRAALAQSPVVGFERVRLGEESDTARVNSIATGSRGAMWIAEYGGLFRYDSSGIRAYRHSDSDSTSLSSNKVFSVHEDRAGNLWVGTHGGSLNRMAPGASGFTHYRADSANFLALGSPAILSIFEDSDGTLWFGTLGGLARFESKLGSFMRFTYAHSSNTVWPIARAPDGALWFGTLGDGLGRLDFRSGQFKAFRKDMSNARALQSGLVVSLLVDRAGALWVGTDGGGLYRLDHTGSDFDHFLGDATVLALAEDRDGTLWIGTYGNGVVHLATTGAEIERFRANPSDSASLPSNLVRALAFDVDGKLWIGTHNAGVVRMLRKAR